MVAGDRYREILDVLDRMEAAVDHGQIKHPVFLVEPRRGHEAVLIEGLGHLGQGQPGRLEADWVDHDMEFRRAAADEIHPGDAGDLEETRLEVVAGDLPEAGQITPGARQADPDDGEI